MKTDRGKVWLGVSAIVVNSANEWLVVKKTYSGLKGVWSLPAGFVQEAETIDEAAIRESKEETGIDIHIEGIVGFRSGVIREEISDNMAIMLAKPLDENQPIQIQEREISCATWLSPEQLAASKESSILLQEIAKDYVEFVTLKKVEDVDPGDVFGYTSYKLFIFN